MENSTLHKYELMLILLSDLGEQKINEEIAEVVKHIESVGGEVFNKDIWGVRDLAYRIKKQDEGYYVVLNFTLPGVKVAELEKGFTINPAVVRSLLIRTPNSYVIKSFADYQEEAEKMAAEKAKQAEEAGEKKKMAAPVRSEKTKKFAPEAKPAKKAKAASSEEAEVKKPKKAAPHKEKLEEVDKKLKSIIDDPDITL